MKKNFGYTGRVGCIRERNHVRVMTVHAAIRHESEQMKSMAARPRKRFLQHAIPIQLTRRDRFINAGEILINNSARSEVEVADFRIAHLSVGEADVESARA